MTTPSESWATLRPGLLVLAGLGGAVIVAQGIVAFLVQAGFDVALPAFWGLFGGLLIVAFVIWRSRLGDA